MASLRTLSALFFLFLCLSFPAGSYAQNRAAIKGKPVAAGSWQKLLATAGKAGKPGWRPMLAYVAHLHQANTHPAQWPFDYEWEGLGPGYVYGEAFGHWDVVHIALDVLNAYPEHALHQLLNDVKNQEPTGMVPGSIYMPGGLSGRDSIYWNKKTEGHPPLWPVAVQAYLDLTGDTAVLRNFYAPLVRQLAWFENNRKAEGEGFFYNDILLKRWESGVDEGVRFDNVKKGPMACVDATAHVFTLYQMATAWSKRLGFDAHWYEQRADALGRFIRDSLYATDDGMFYDRWAVQDPSLRHLAFESMWPLVVGAATKEQANTYITKYLLDTAAFLTVHPLATVGKKDPKFERRMWRGPAWNSMTYWAAHACIRYGRKDAAKVLLERALDASARQFARTGTIWEFYDSLGGNPEDVKRKPHTKFNSPSKDYLGHNPLIAMALLYDSVM